MIKTWSQFVSIVYIDPLPLQSLHSSIHIGLIDHKSSRKFAHRDFKSTFSPFSTLNLILSHL